MSPDGTLLAGSTRRERGASRRQDRRGPPRVADRQQSWLAGHASPTMAACSPPSAPETRRRWCGWSRPVSCGLDCPWRDWAEMADFSPDGSTLYTAGGDTSLRQWDLDGSRRFLAQVAPPTLFGWGEGVVVAPGGGHVAYQLPESVIFLDVRAGKLGRALERPAGSTGLRGVWDPHGRRYAMPTGDQVTVWDARTDDVLVQGRPAESDVTGIDFSTDGSRLAIADVSGAVVMVDPGTLEPLGAPVRLEDVPCAVSLGPDNRTAFVATGPPKSAWEFWRVPCPDWALVDLESGSVLDRGTMEGGIGRLDFSPAGNRVAVEVSGALVELDVQTGQPVRPPVAAHDGTVLSLTYSPNGSLILTAGKDASAALWDAEHRPTHRQGRHPAPPVDRAVRRRRTISARRRRVRGDRPPVGHPPGLRRRVRLPTRGTRLHARRVGRAVRRSHIPGDVPAVTPAGRASTAGHTQARH